MNFYQSIEAEEEFSCSDFTCVYIGEDDEDNPLIDSMSEFFIFKKFIIASNNIAEPKRQVLINPCIFKDSFCKLINKNSNLFIISDMSNKDYINETINICKYAKNRGNRIILCCIDLNRDNKLTEELASLIDYIDISVVIKPEKNSKDSIPYKFRLALAKHTMKKMIQTYMIL